MARHLHGMHWIDVQNERMIHDGSEQKAVRLGMCVMSMVQLVTDFTNRHEMTNVLIALDRVKAEVSLAQRKQEQRDADEFKKDRGLK